MAELVEEKKLHGAESMPPPETGRQRRGTLRLETVTSRGNDVQEQQAASPATNTDVNVARFDGSFAPHARPEQARVKPWYKDRDYFLSGWTDKSIWKAAFVEGVATTGITYVSGQITGTIMSYGTAQIGAYIGISNIALLSLFIYATAAATGGHINPLISFSAMLAGICPVPRGVLYICGQIAGAALGGGLLLGVWGAERATKYQGGGCFYDAGSLSIGQAFLTEMVSCFIVLYLAYGVGLDPRQAIFFGPRVGPLLVGVTIGLMTFATSGSVPGFAGAQMNPARCFAYAITRREMEHQWIWWIAPAAASILFSMMYNWVPPKFAEPPQHESRAQGPEMHDV